MRATDDQKQAGWGKKLLMGCGVALGIVVAMFALFIMWGLVDTFILTPNTPTDRTVPTRTTTQGLGVSRAEIQTAFSHPEMGWVSTESAPLADGTPRQLAKFDFGTASLELIGPDKNLTSVAIFVDDSMSNDSDFFLNALYLSMVLNLTVPNWDRPSEWLAANIGTADEGGKPVEYYGGKVISLRTFTATETIMVKVEVDSQQ